jgi:hypothetical protein
MPARFAATENAFEKGVDNITPAAAIKLIDDWEVSLKDADIPGAKTIVRDLEALKKALHAGQPDGEKIKALVGKLAEETTKIAGHATPSTKDKVVEPGKTIASVK